MKRKIYVIISIILFILSNLLVGCSSEKDDSRENIEKFINKHYSITTENLKIDFDKPDQVSDHMKSFSKFMTNDGYESYKVNSPHTVSIKTAKNENFTAEIKEIKISETDKKDDMRCFDVSFVWIIKSVDNEILKEQAINKKIYLSKDNSSWKINQYNKFECIFKDITVN